MFKGSLTQSQFPNAHLITQISLDPKDLLIHDSMFTESVFGVHYLDSGRITAAVSL